MGEPKVIQKQGSGVAGWGMQITESQRPEKANGNQEKKIKSSLDFHGNHSQLSLASSAPGTPQQVCLPVCLPVTAETMH